MYVNHDDLQAIASSLNNQDDSILSAMDDEVVSLKFKVCVAIQYLIFILFFFFELCILMTQIQSNKQDIGHLHKKLKIDVNEYRNSEPSTSRVHSRWNNDEVMIAIQGKINGIFCPV